MTAVSVSTVVSSKVGIGVVLPRRLLNRMTSWLRVLLKELVSVLRVAVDGRLNLQ